MKAESDYIEEKIDELLAVLDKDIEQINANLSRLDELRRYVIKRDDISLSRLLERIRTETDDYSQNESARQLLRKELASVLGCSFKQMTLSRLQESVYGEKQVQINSRKTTLRALAEKLRKEHLSTTLLLSDCARFNSMLLRNVFNFPRVDTIEYTSRGSRKHRTDTTFINMKF